VQRPDSVSEPLYPIEVGFDDDKNMSSFLHSQRREERENGPDPCYCTTSLVRIARYPSRGSFLIPNRHPKVQLAAESVASILQSKRPDDDISSELAELLGFEDIDLVMALMHNRSKLVEHLAVRALLLWIPPAYI
jgi:hypothetical protein